jgi:uncharacterized protein YkwD
MGPMLTRRRVATLILCGALVSGPLNVQPAHAAKALPAEKALKRLINATRADDGLPALKLSMKPIKPTRQHAKKMAAQQKLWHSDISATLKNVSWSWAAENVGVASKVSNLHNAFMSSSAHRNNILGKSWDKMVIGIAKDANGMRWATVVFYGK